MGVEEARFYAQVYEPARNGSLAALRRTGCSEEEAEDFFATAFEKVMEKVDPIQGEFLPPQMVEYIKRASWRCMIDERRRRVQRVEVELDSVHSLSDDSAVSPAEAAVDQEAIAIGREALQTLSERDREIFRLRHQLDLSPKEILEKTPGLSMRTYRKVLERANARVLAAFERIEGGERCEEMETKLLHRYIADECSEAEESAIKAHLDHCRSCQLAQARLRGHLFDLASGLAVVATVAETGARSIDSVGGGGWEVVSGGVRFIRDRARDLGLRMFTSAPGTSGGDATVGQALFGSPLKALTTCVSGVAAGGACVAALGGLPVGGLLSNVHHHHHHPRAKHTRLFTPPSQSTELIDPLPTATPDSTSATPTKEAAKKPRVSGATRPGSSTASPTRASESGSVSNSASSARISPVETGNEFGPGSEQSPTPTPSPSPAPSSGSGSSASGGGSSSGGNSSESSEFGM